MSKHYSSSEDKSRGLRDERIARGRRAEQLAADYLIGQGYEILHRNWRCRSGELDLVAKKEGVLVVVEVRSRKSRNSAFGTPAESVTARKIKQVRDTAAIYFQRTGKSAALIRFDVVAVTFGLGDELTLEHIKAAF
ncbi:MULTISPECIES: YraN family protein [Paenibacillus]|uniref:YraN family protein n=1 Tax=Paenibacillus TaxID=44249 RepID=UPI002FDFBCBC